MLVSYHNFVSRVSRVVIIFFPVTQSVFKTLLETPLMATSAPLQTNLVLRINIFEFQIGPTLLYTSRLICLFSNKRVLARVLTQVQRVLSAVLEYGLVHSLTWIEKAAISRCSNFLSYVNIALNTLGNDA